MSRSVSGVMKGVSPYNTKTISADGSIWSRVCSMAWPVAMLLCLEHVLHAVANDGADTIGANSRITTIGRRSLIDSAVSIT